MQQVLLAIHLIIALAMIGAVLIQRSEGGGLGIGGSGGMGGFMTVRGTANVLTRTTAILAGCFMVTSLLLAILASGSGAPQPIVQESPLTVPAPDQAPAAQPETPPATPAPAAPTSD